MNITDLQKKVTELKELKLLKEQLEAEMSGIEDEIKAYMGEREELIVGACKIRYKTVKSSRFDSSAFKKVNPDVYAMFTKEIITRRFTVA